MTHAKKQKPKTKDKRPKIRVLLTARGTAANRRQRNFNSPVSRSTSNSRVGSDGICGSHAVCLNPRGIDACRLKAVRQGAGAILRELLQRNFVALAIAKSFDLNLIIR